MKTCLIIVGLLSCSSVYAVCDIKGSPENWIADSCMWAHEAGPESSTVKRCIRKELKAQGNKSDCQIKKTFKRRVCGYRLPGVRDSQRISACMKQDFVPVP